MSVWQGRSPLVLQHRYMLSTFHIPNSDRFTAKTTLNDSQYYVSFELDFAKSCVENLSGLLYHVLTGEAFTSLYFNGVT
jgi:hypothetical protein